MSVSNRLSLFLALLVAVLLATGCEKSPQFGRVQGTVTMNGQPLDQVRVVFLPDPESGNRGAISRSITDDQGKYDLVYSQDTEKRGAIVGWQRVVVEDIKGENNRDRFYPIRVPENYSSSAKTPLRYEVKPEEQTFDIDIKE